MVNNWLRDIGGIGKRVRHYDNMTGTILDIDDNGNAYVKWDDGVIMWIDPDYISIAEED